MRLRTLTPVLLLTASVCLAQAPLSLHAPAVLTAIEKAFPGATIVTTADVDTRDCDAIPESPGFVVGDFDGDGRADFAVLLKDGETGRVVSWEGKQQHETRYVLAMLLDDGAGNFTAKRLYSFLQFWPVLAFIEPVSGRVKGLGDDRRGAEIVLSNPGISFTVCGKYSVVYYLANHQVRKFLLGD